jgi:NADPH:quinone reductase-like Zn-dependent oxidoreductase
MTMKAVIWTGYGPPDVLELREVEKPLLKDNEVLIRNYATTVTAGDCELRNLKLPLYYSLPMRLWLGFSKPRGNRIPGTEFAGEIVETGKDVTRFKPGDQVFGSTGLGFGAYAEFVCLPEVPVEGTLAIKPYNLTFEEAASVPFGGKEALHFLSKANLHNGQKILINGACGSIGTFAVQLAKHFGAQVAAVDKTGKLDVLRSIGADQVIDYTQQDFTKNGETYYVILDLVGKLSLMRAARSLKPDGMYLLANPGPSQMIAGLWIRLTSRKKVFMQPASGSNEDLFFLKELIEAGKIRTVIDRCYPLEQIVEAHHYVESGQKKGNVVITVAHEQST